MNKGNKKKLKEIRTYSFAIELNGEITRIDVCYGNMCKHIQLQ